MMTTRDAYGCICMILGRTVEVDCWLGSLESEFIQHPSPVLANFECLDLMPKNLPTTADCFAPLR